MSEYKCIRVINKELSKEDFKKAYNFLCKLETGIISEDGCSILFSGKSEKKQRFSVDSGCYTTELRAFTQAVKWYLGKYEYGVEVHICE